MLLWILVAFAILQGILEWLPVSSEGQTVTLLTGFLGVTPDEALERRTLKLLGNGELRTQRVINSKV